MWGRGLMLGEDRQAIEGVRRLGQLVGVAE
jgi:hypothetical protein